MTKKPMNQDMESMVISPEEGVALEIRTRNHRLIVDQPMEKEERVLGLPLFNCLWVHFALVLVIMLFVFARGIIF